MCVHVYEWVCVCVCARVRACVCESERICACHVHVLSCFSKLRETFNSITCDSGGRINKNDVSLSHFFLLLFRLSFLGCCCYAIIIRRRRIWTLVFYPHFRFSAPSFSSLPPLSTPHIGSGQRAWHVKHGGQQETFQWLYSRTSP